MTADNLGWGLVVLLMISVSALAVRRGLVNLDRPDIIARVPPAQRRFSKFYFTFALVGGGFTAAVMLYKIIGHFLILYGVVSASPS